MTLEEAKKLKPGDKVLVEAEVTFSNHREKPDEHMTFYGNVSVKVAMCGTHPASYWCVSPEVIREKIEPPRRKFREGDIVRYTGSGTLTYVCRDELEDGSVFVGGLTKSVRCVFLKLICPVDERHDIPAADGSGETRKEVERG